MATVFRLPDIGEGLTEAEIVEWMADEGDEVRADHPLVLVETDKTQAELPSPVTGVLLHRGAAEGTVLEVGEILAVVGEPGEAWRPEGEDRDGEPSASRATEQAGSPPLEGASGAFRPPALPLVRRAARDAGVDITDVMGTGPGGRVTRADLTAHLQRRDDPVERPPLVGTLDESAEDLTERAGDGDRTIRLSPTRRAIADRLSRAWREIPHVTTYGSFDATGLLAERRRRADELGHPVPVEALVMHALALVLEAHPEFNATLDGDRLSLHRLLHCGFAVDGGDGLLVAVVHDAGQKSVGDLATEVASLATAAKDRALTREQMTGSTFTISNIGAVGGGYGTPIIPLGTTAILSIGRAEDSVVVRNGGIHVAPMAPLSLSYDHRVIDGALGRAFMGATIEALSGRS